jgi:hypothetical protein
MFLRRDAGRCAVVMQELLGFVKAQTQSFANSSSRELPFGVTLQEKRLQKLAGAGSLVEVKLLGYMVWHFNGYEHELSLLIIIVIVTESEG